MGLKNREWLNSKLLCRPIWKEAENRQNKGQTISTVDAVPSTVHLKTCVALLKWTQIYTIILLKSVCHCSQIAGRNSYSIVSRLSQLVRIDCYFFLSRVRISAQDIFIG